MLYILLTRNSLQIVKKKKKMVKSKRMEKMHHANVHSKKAGILSLIPL